VVESHEERIGRNEALFRQVNERLEELGQAFSFVAETADFVCECGDIACAAPIQMTLADYERIRANPTWFAVLAKHELLDVEEVVERHGDWNVVAKRAGTPAAVARAEDPRS
jgi:hypothetical protein